MLLRDRPWDRNLQLLLAAIVGFNILPHAPRLPIWVLSIAGCALAWKVLYLTRGWQLPARGPVAALGLASALIVYNRFGTFVGNESSSALLAIMASLKLLETNRYRDAIFVLFTSLFLLMSYLIESQSLTATGFMLIDLVLITSMLFKIHRRDLSLPKVARSRAVLRFWGFVLPIWALLFFVFPRFSSNIWNAKPPASAVGFDDRLDAGTIDRLVESGGVAFRVSFKGTSGLNPRETYFRGAMLSEGEGLRWAKPAKNSLAAEVLLKDDQGATFDASIWLEPDFATWLFAPDVPLSLRSNDLTLLQSAQKQSGFIYSSRVPLLNRVNYTTTSLISPPAERLRQADLQHYLQLPDRLSDEVKALARDLRGRATQNTEDEYARSILDWFRQQNFRYTKSPGILPGEDPVRRLDAFLFSSRRGFCEHFAASFATLMRAMRVPARVVIGFQGGTPNRWGDYWLVRKSDAHAWTEIWIADQKRSGADISIGHWQRVDPTQTIAPMRLEFGGDFYDFPEESIAGLTDDEMRRRLENRWQEAARGLALTWDYLEMSWNAFLLRYDLDQQTRLFSALMAHLGLALTDHIPQALAALALMTTLLASIAWSLALRRQAQRLEPLVLDWRHFCRRFERYGLVRGANEGPLTFAARASTRFPSRAARIQNLARRYAELRYGPANSRESRRALARELRRFALDEQPKT